MSFIELERLEKLLASALRQQERGVLRTRVLAHVDFRGQSFPLHSLVIGSTDKSAPTLGLFGGVHGLERVGSHVVIAYLKGLLAQLAWDERLQEFFKSCRLVCLPIVNPAGMFANRRSNGNGIDLMRNSPVEATHAPWLLGGHRYSAHLPWYRGAAGAPMEKEAQSLVDFVQEEIFPSRAALLVDCHSGFGLRDRFWYPYARNKERYPQEKAIQSLTGLLNTSLPYHIYTVEGQSQNYTNHGDLWDHLCDLYFADAQREKKLFVPWTLEMGSWIWIRKNPWQLFSLPGPFNPIKPHRYRRTMRRPF